MAIDVLRRQGKSAVTGILGKNARRIAGNIGSVIRGDVGSGESSDFAPINRNKQSTKMLSFPIDVGADPGIGNHGHYIMFFINELESAKLSFGGGFAEGNKQDAGLENIASETRRRKLKATGKVFDEKRQTFLDSLIPNKVSNQLIEGLDDITGGFGIGNKGRIKTEVKHNVRQIKDQTVAIERPATRRLDTTIAMYMPPTVKTTYAAQYTDTSIALGTGAAVAALEKLTTGDREAAREKLTAAIGEGAGGTARAVANELDPGIIAQLEATDGKILSDRMELAFKGVDKRKFTYDFKMMPRSKREADEVAEIIYVFKFHMLPEMTGTKKDGRSLSYPSTFDIQYMYVNQENNYLHKISTCYLESMDVTYGGARYTTFDGNEDGAPPVETNITLNFAEIELITRERVTEGF